MNVLQMSASYHLSKLYKNMIRQFDSKNINQTVYTALKDMKYKNINKIEDGNNLTYVYSAPFKRYDSFIYYSKIHKIYKDVIKKVNLDEINLIHAHFLFSDGGVAYKLHENYGIDYIVAIRNTDLNVFFKYGVHVRGYGVNILKKAKKIILISESYRSLILNDYISKKDRAIINDKMITIPNGIDEYWLKNKPEIQRKAILDEEVIQLIYVGRLDKNKNMKTVFEVMELIEKEKYEVNLKVVGTGELEDELKQLANKKELDVKFYGYIKSKTELRKLYKESYIFIMPSIYETFGLVYIEAMSQGLPVIYTENQGIYGYFKEGTVGYASDPFNSEEIKENILKILDNYNKISSKAIEEAQKFNWDKITDKYIELYKEVLKGE